MRRILSLIAVLAPSLALADYFEIGFHAEGYFEFNYFVGGSVIVPNVVGLSATDADIALEAVGLDTGGITARCSAETVDTVLSQSPLAASQVTLATTIDLVTSNGVACTMKGLPRLRPRGLSIGL